MTNTETHGVAPDKGRNVHCLCGDEYSLRVNLMRHIQTNTPKPLPTQKES